MKPSILIVMGVSGSGKTTIATLLAGRLGWAYQEGDTLHPPENVAKMRAGIPLTDQDRHPWLATIAAWVAERVRLGEPGIITCSALKRAYRDQIIGGHAEACLVYLHGDHETLQQHVTLRHHEYMPPALLESQLRTLEEPGPDEPLIQVDVGKRVDETVTEILAQLDQRR